MIRSLVWGSNWASGIEHILTQKAMATSEQTRDHLWQALRDPTDTRVLSQTDPPKMGDNTV
jgi:hypothetical protein